MKVFRVVIALVFCLAALLSTTTFAEQSSDVPTSQKKQKRRGRNQPSNKKRSSATSKTQQTALAETKAFRIPQSEDGVFIVTPETLPLLMESEKIILLDVYAEWCNPCKRMGPIFSQSSLYFAKSPLKVCHAKIMMDSFDESDTTIMFLKATLDVSITLVPTLLLIENGKVRETFKGSRNYETLVAEVTALLPEKN